MLARLTSCLSPFLGFSLSLSCSLRCLSRWRWWRTIRLQDDIVVIMVILIMSMIITMMLVSVPIRLKCNHIIPPTTSWLSWNVFPKWKSKKHTASQTGELSFEWFIGGKHRLFMFPLSKRSKKHTRVNYHGLVYWGKGLGWKRSILSLSRPIQSPRKKVDKRFQLGDVYLKEPL